jgi:hypothetical protein
MVQPGMTHLGKPLQTVPLGRTTLPMDVIMDYLESMKEIYTTEVSIGILVVNEEVAHC